MTPVIPMHNDQNISIHKYLPKSFDYNFILFFSKNKKKFVVNNLFDQPDRLETKIKHDMRNEVEKIIRKIETFR